MLWTTRKVELEKKQLRSKLGLVSRLSARQTNEEYVPAPGNAQFIHDDVREYTIYDVGASGLKPLLLLLLSVSEFGLKTLTTRRGVTTYLISGSCFLRDSCRTFADKQGFGG